VFLLLRLYDGLHEVYHVVVSANMSQFVRQNGFNLLFAQACEHRHGQENPRATPTKGKWHLNHRGHIKAHGRRNAEPRLQTCEHYDPFGARLFHPAFELLNPYPAHGSTRGKQQNAGNPNANSPPGDSNMRHLR
jgi:hypothetical protein